MTLEEIKKELNELIIKMESVTDPELLAELDKRKVQLYNKQFALSIGKI